MSDYLSPGPDMLEPRESVAGYSVCPGMFAWNGATVLGYDSAVSFTVHSSGATAVELLLFHKDQDEPYATIPFPKRYRIGDVWSMAVFGLDITEFEYAYRVDGAWKPSKGLLFDKKHILLDIYAKAVTGRGAWGQAGKERAYRARVVRTSQVWDDEIRGGMPMEDLIIYELHVRGFTMGKNAGVSAPGTFEGIREKIPYLKWLGITAVEMMPIFEFDEMQNAREYEGKQLIDYWGYNTVSYFAPNTGYTSTPEYNHEGTELRSLIADLHRAGIQVILDVVFNHTAEGNEDGTFISFKGFDNNIYYMLKPEGGYYNFSGCGNTVNCNHPVVQEMIVECLRYWTVNYHIDGFRFDLASILGRNEDGSPMEYPPLLQRLAKDPLLAGVKLIAEAWDAGGLYQVGSFPAWKRWAEWNGKYRDDVRSFLKGDYWAAPEASRRIIGSPDLYSNKPSEEGRSPRGYVGYNSSINFLTCHDGFTLYDLYAYNGKHNEANGWGNTDGSNDNRSWNCGVEGPSEDPRIEELRIRMMKNAMAVLMMSRGTPMFLAGDEFANTQYGNNNGYCQDNEVSWLDWNFCDRNRSMLEFTRQVISFRRDHDCIRRDLKRARCGFPNISIHAGTPWNALVTKETKAFYVIYAGYDENRGQDDIVCLAINVFWEPLEITLPDLPEGRSWHLFVSTGGEERGMAWKKITMRPRSVAILSAETFRQP